MQWTAARSCERPFIPGEPIWMLIHQSPGAWEEAGTARCAESLIKWTNQDAAKGWRVSKRDQLEGKTRGASETVCLHSLFLLFRAHQALHNLVSGSLSSCDILYPKLPATWTTGQSPKISHAVTSPSWAQTVPSCLESAAPFWAHITSSFPWAATTSPGRMLLFQGPGPSYKSWLWHISCCGLLHVFTFLIPEFFRDRWADFTS